MEKIDALGIEKKDIENGIKKGMKWKEDDSEKWHANMTGIESVFIKKEDIIFIITVYEN